MYNLKHLGLYKNIPKKRMFNTTPNYERDSYTLLQYKSHLRNEFLIPLKADGDGTGVATIYLQSTEDQTINITGAGRFYTDAQGTIGESTSAVVGTSLTTLYVKLNAGSCYLVLTKADKLLGLGSSSVSVITEATNAPFINGCNLGYKLHNVSVVRLSGNNKSFFTGSIDDCQSLSYFNISNNQLCVITGSIDSCPSLSYLNISNNQLCVITGSIDSCPSLAYLIINGNTLCAFTGSIDSCPSLAYLIISGNTLCAFTGSIDNCPNMNTFNISNNQLCVITGSIDSCPSLSYLNISNNQLCVITGSIDSCHNLSFLSIYRNPLCVITGDIGKAILCYYFNCTGNESPLTYVTRRSNWTSSLRLIYISSASMTTEMLDNLFIDIDSSGVPAANEKLINVGGLCAPVSDASLAARNSLVSKGFTVVVNT